MVVLSKVGVISCLTLIPPQPKLAVAIPNAFATQPAHVPPQMVQRSTPTLAFATVLHAQLPTCVVTQQRRAVHYISPAQIVQAPSPTMRRVGVLAQPLAVEECFVTLLFCPLIVLLRHVRSLKPLEDRSRCPQHAS